MYPRPGNFPKSPAAAKPAPAAKPTPPKLNPGPRFTVVNYTPVNKKGLIGLVTFRLGFPDGSGLHFVDCPFLRSAGKEWINFPARPYTTKEGKTSYVNILKWDNREQHERWHRAMVQRLKDFIQATGGSLEEIR